MASLTVSDSSMFEVGQKISIASSTVWPRWTRFFPTFRVWFRWIASKFGKEVGPRPVTEIFEITAIHGSTLEI